MDRPRSARRALCRRRHHLPAALGAGLLLGVASPAFADDTSDLRREMTEMRRQYEAELRHLRRDYDARLRRLETRLKERQDKPVETAAVPSPIPSGAAATPQSASAAVTAPQTVPALPPVPSSTSAISAFNPAIGLVLSGQAAAFKRNPGDYFVRGFALGEEAGPGTRGFSLSETEINFQATVDPYLYGNLTIAIEPSNEVAVEEAFIQSTSLPYGFTLRGGRFFSGIGYLNEQHAHTWDFVDQALPYRAFLNNQYGDDGAQLRWLAPTAQFLEFGAELFRGDSFPAGGAGRQGFGTYSLFAHTGGDIDPSNTYRAGASWLRTSAVDRTTPNGGSRDLLPFLREKFADRTTPFPPSPDDVFNGRGDTFIADLVYKWAPDGNPVETNLKVQGEFFARHERGQFNGLDYDGWQTGFYAQAIYQFMPRWRIGVRYDQVNGTHQNNALAFSTVDSQGSTPRRASAMLEYNTSEFGRFRLQYNRDWSRGTPDDQGFLQYVITLGAHGAHLF